MRLRTRTWSEIMLDYEELEYEHSWNIEPLVELVRFIEASPYARYIFGATSHADLHVGRVPNFARGDNELEVKYDNKSKTFTFTYFQRPDDQNPWSTTCDSESWREKFEHLLHHRLRWFESPGFPNVGQG